MARPRRKCTFSGCDNDHYGRGMCKMHYYQLRNKGHLAKYNRENREYQRENQKTGVPVAELKEKDRENKGIDWCIDKIKRLHPDKITLLVSYFMKQAEIVTKEEMKRIKDSKKWLSSIVQKVHGYWTEVMDDPDASDTLKFNVSKEILSRIVPPKQEMIVKDEYRDRSMDELISEADRALIVVEKSAKKKEESFQRNPVGRPEGT